MTTYETLQNSVSEKQKIYDAANARILALQNDANINTLKSILNDPRVVGTHDGWIDGGSVYGTFWKGEDAKQARDGAIGAITKWNADTLAASAARTDAKNQLDNAAAALTTYERQSPTIASQIAKQKADIAEKLASVGFRNTKNLLFLIGGLIALSVVGFLIYKKYGKKTATA